MTKLVLQICAWAALSAIAFATLAPIGLRPHSILPVAHERGGALAVVGALFAFAYPSRIWWTLGGLVIGLVGLEALQVLRPDRHGQPLDALVKIIGAGIGYLLAALVLLLSGKRSGVQAGRALPRQQIGGD